MTPHISARAAGIAASVTLSIDAAAKAMQAQGLDVVGFGAGEPDFNTPAHICDAAKEALDRGMTRYTPSSGTLDLRKAICDKLKRDNGLTYEPSQIVVSCGAKHSLFQILQTICDPMEEVLIPSPCWVSYPEMVRMAGGIPVFVHASEQEGFKPTIQALKNAITDKTRAIILTSPSNPTGAVLTRDEMQAIADLMVSKGIYVISDEIYEELIYDGLTHISIASLGQEIKDLTFVINGVSKAYAMTGWRIGYCAGPKAVMEAMGNFQSHAASNPNSMAQYASLAAINGGREDIVKMRDAFDERRKILVNRINDIDGLSCPTPKGAFYVMMKISALFGKTHHGKVISGSLDFCDILLKEKQVAVVPGAAFEADDYVRMSYATSLQNIEKGMARIEDFVSELQ